MSKVRLTDIMTGLHKQEHHFEYVLENSTILEANLTAIFRLELIRGILDCIYRMSTLERRQFVMDMQQAIHDYVNLGVNVYE